MDINKVITEIETLERIFRYPTRDRSECLIAPRPTSNTTRNWQTIRGSGFGSATGSSD
jgi:hypothetical protein